jgi:hypothetical protein
MLTVCLLFENEPCTTEANGAFLRALDCFCRGVCGFSLEQFCPNSVSSKGGVYLTPNRGECPILCAGKRLTDRI